MDPAERRRRARAIQAQVRENDVTKWVQGLLADLDGQSAT
jgi:trehalose-6-phosphate synthase